MEFEEIAGFPDSEVRLIYREVTSDDLATALMTAPSPVVEKFFANMPSTTSDLIKETMEQLGQLPDETIEAARKKVLDVVAVLRSK